MTSDQIILFSLFGLVFALLLWGRIRYDIVALSALLIGVIVGVVPADQAFSGFGHPATIVVALVLVVSAGLVRSGAVFLITRTLVDQTRSLGSHIAIMGGVGGILSAFMNNVAALALLMPVDIQTARKAERSPSVTLMPLSFATILGGMVTLIGTPPNILIATIREDRLGESFAMFDFAPVGGLVAIAGLAFVALVGWRLIPVGQNAAGSSGTLNEIADYVSELTVADTSRAMGKTIGEIALEAEDTDAAVIGLVRGGKRRRGPQRSAVAQEGDVLIVEARPDALEEFRSAFGLTFTDAERTERLQLAGAGLRVVEAVVQSGSRIEGRNAQSIGLDWRQRTILLGISRQGRRITKSVRKTDVQAGDILLLLAPSDTAEDVLSWLDVLPLVERGLTVTQNEKTWLAIGLFAAAVFAAALGWVYLPVALGLVVVGYALTKILPVKEIYSHIEWPVVVLLGSMIPLGVALETAGGTELIADALLSRTEGFPAWAVLAILMVVTMTLSDVLNNTATTIVAAPIAIEMARTLGVSPDPFLMAVAIAASSAFLTPIGHKNNTLILGPGGYKFGDYWRMGLPLEGLVIAVAIPSILVFWPL